MGVLFVGLVFGGILTGPSSQKSTSSDQTSQQPTIVEEEKTEAEQEKSATTEPQTPEIFELNGSGQKATEKFTLQKGLAVFEMTHSGSHNFAIWLMDEEGNRIELLVNEIGPFDGSKAVRIPRDGQYLLDIDADGDWTVNIK